MHPTSIYLESHKVLDEGPKPVRSPDGHARHQPSRLLSYLGTVSRFAAHTGKAVVQSISVSLSNTPMPKLKSFHEYEGP